MNALFDSRQSEQLRQIVEIVAMQYQRRPLWRQIVPLMRAGKNLKEIVAATGASKMRVQRAMERITRERFIALAEAASEYVEYEEYYGMTERLAGIDPRTEHGRRYMAHMIAVAPPRIRKYFDDELRRLGLLPEVKYRDADGEPVFSAQQISDLFGVPLDDVEAEMQRLIDEHGDSVARAVDPANINAVQ